MVVRMLLLQMAQVDGPVELDVARLDLTVCLVLEPDLESLARIAS
jgi:hypothetical protein